MKTLELYDVNLYFYEACLGRLLLEEFDIALTEFNFLLKISLLHCSRYKVSCLI